MARKPTRGNRASRGSAGQQRTEGVPPSLVLAALEAVSKFLREHFLAVLASIGATVILVIWAILSMKNACLTLPHTPIGPVSVCEGNTDRDVGPDGLRGRLYTDRRAGFSLELPDSQQWSVIQPQANSDGTSTIVFAPGVLGPIPVTMIVRDVAAVFVGKTSSEGGAPSAWVFRVPADRVRIEQFVATEAANLRRTSTVWTTYAVAEMLRESNRARSERHGAESTQDARVLLSQVQYAPSRRDALLVWERPQVGLPIDLVGRVVVAERDIYYVVTLTISGDAPHTREINAALRKVLESFHPL